MATTLIRFVTTKEFHHWVDNHVDDLDARQFFKKSLNALRFRVGRKNDYPIELVMDLKGNLVMYPKGTRIADHVVRGVLARRKYWLFGPYTYRTTVR